MRLFTFALVGAFLASSVYLCSHRALDNFHSLGNAPRVTPQDFSEESTRMCNNGSKRPSGACAYYNLSLGRMSSSDCVLAGGDAYFCCLGWTGLLCQTQRKCSHNEHAQWGMSPAKKTTMTSANRQPDH
ncbi:hypothetical protein F5J12DRAFT_90893 [Pisolithus orientalis]|uniref:uncharacterized protein n=1 Tax=Pisolithus orientalis TaxID=936130 RepID=UPI0022254C7B|nr:uncharacterized protein F5J12DRAFT_90893 [Pisolithus orientalis]KAI6007779.1 hypothetical protein F5J12DRAFT_90893 [Pisolithus orientalis]